MRRALTTNWRKAACILTLLTGARAAHAGYFELSANGAYYRYNNGTVGGVDSTTTVQRLGGGIAYRFLANTSIELSYSDQRTTDRFGQLDDFGFKYDISRKTRIQTTSVNLILDFADRKSRFRPFISGGGGYMTRTTTTDWTRTDTNSLVTTVQPTSKTVIYSATAETGIGCKMFVADSVALEASFNMYASDLDKPQIYIHYSAAAGLRFLF